MRVLVVDDEKNIRDSIKKYLSFKNIVADCAENGLSAKRFLEEKVYQAAIIDLRMPGIDGIELLNWIRQEGPAIPVMMISAYGEIRDAVKAIKMGAVDYIVKPFDPEELFIRLNKAINDQKLKEQFSYGKRNNQEVTDFIGNSKQILKIKNIIKTIASTPSSVLITGESGTGKEVIACSIHNLSGKSCSSFIALNINAIPQTLLESELFGYEKGAFTGADKRKMGLFELANQGTLFLDEIGDMPLHLQVKLLRVLQEMRIIRLGGTQPIPINVRIIAATNKDLEHEIRQGNFREDLFYRLNVVRISAPPLREHLEDVPALCGFLIEKLSKKLSTRTKKISVLALNRLKAYNFPGNVRELENILERAIIFSTSDTIQENDLDIPNSKKQVIPQPYSLKEMEKKIITEALYKWEGKREKAAKELGITRRTLLNKIKEYNIIL